MPSQQHVFRVHPAIGIARVGNTEEFYLGPETMAGLPVDGDARVTGGLPIVPGTDAQTITSADLRDRNGALKRQAARFRIYQYPRLDHEHYPTGAGTEIVIGSAVDGKTVKDVIWTVHLANKKANSYLLNDNLGLAVYQKVNAEQLHLRNEPQGLDPNNAARIRRLVIDPGPRAVRGSATAPVRFNKSTVASYWRAGNEIAQSSAYPTSFPDDSFAQLYTPTGPIDTLGELRTDDKGRLLVLGGYGKACGWLQPDGTPFPLIGGMIAPGEYGDVNADGWFDDTGDGPVSAVIVFDDESVESVHPAWVVTTDPSYAPQTLNVVSLWDDIFDTWVRRMDLLPDLFDHRYKDAYRPSFTDHLFPIFRAPALQRWNTNLPERAIAAHDAVARITATDDPAETIMTGLAYVRDPNAPRQSSLGAPFMPLSMGDAGKAFLTVTLTQWFFLTQWNKKRFDAERRMSVGPGEYLDRAVLVNCLGGRFAPGIEMTFMVRDPAVYRADWKEAGCGPFRFRARPLDYDAVQYSRPFLTVGYIPFHLGPDGITSAPLEPGDATKFMAVPWHTDYNACATHNSAPNPEMSSALYWSWPSQRPVAVQVASDVRDGQLGPQRYSIRGAGTVVADLGDAGRYQNLLDMIANWHRIGFVIQGTAIAGDIDYSGDQYLEVASLLDEPEIVPWPMNSTAIGS